MQKYKLLLFVAFFIMYLTSDVLAQNESYETNPLPPNAGWGIALRGGGAFFTEDPLTNTEGDPGILINGQVFYTLDRMWNMGVMAEWSSQDIEVSGVELGSAQTISVLPFIEFHYRAGRLSPFVSAGLGLNFNSIQEDRNVTTACATFGVGACDFKPENTVAFRLGAGTDIFIADNLAVNLEGAWKLNSGDIRFKVGGATGARANFHGNVAQAMVGLKYYFQ